MTNLKYYFTCIQKIINRFAHIRNIGRFSRNKCNVFDNQWFTNVILP